MSGLVVMGGGEGGVFSCSEAMLILFSYFFLPLTVPLLLLLLLFISLHRVITHPMGSLSMLARVGLALALQTKGNVGRR